MSHIPRKLHPEFPIHVTARCNNRERFPVALPEAWDIFSDYLHLLHQYQILIHSFTLMQNHFHLICLDPETNLSKGMNTFMRETSKEMNRLSGRINRVWGGPFHSSIISNPRYYLYAYKYNYRNPVAAGICRKVEDYPWSTLQILLGQKRGIIPLEKDETLFPDVEGALGWLNESYEEQEAQSIRHALGKKVFKFPLAKNRCIHPLDKAKLPEFYAASFENLGGGFRG